MSEVDWKIIQEEFETTDISLKGFSNQVMSIIIPRKKFY